MATRRQSGRMARVRGASAFRRWVLRWGYALRVEEQLNDDFERADATEEGLVADYGREIVGSVSGVR